LSRSIAWTKRIVRLVSLWIKLLLLKSHLLCFLILDCYIYLFDIRIKYTALRIAYDFRVNIEYVFGSLYLRLKLFHITDTPIPVWPFGVSVQIVSSAILCKMYILLALKRSVPCCLYKSVILTFHNRFENAKLYRYIWDLLKIVSTVLKFLFGLPWSDFRCFVVIFLYTWEIGIINIY